MRNRFPAELVPQANKTAFVLVREDVLPEVYSKVIKVKSGIAKGRWKSINQACKDCKLSRSAYYKYRDAVQADPSTWGKSQLYLQLTVEQQEQMLARLLQSLLLLELEVVHLAQSLSLNGFYSLSLTLNCLGRIRPTEELLTAIRHIQGVRSVQLNLA